MCLQFGVSNVQFIDRRIMLGQVPLQLTTTRTALIRNNDSTHAFFEVTMTYALSDLEL